MHFHWNKNTGSSHQILSNPGISKDTITSKWPQVNSLRLFETLFFLLSLFLCPLHWVRNSAACKFYVHLLQTSHFITPSILFALLQIAHFIFSVSHVSLYISIPSEICTSYSRYMQQRELYNFFKKGFRYSAVEEQSKTTWYGKVACN